MIDPGMFFIGDSLLPVKSWLTRRGVKGVLRQITPNADVIAVVHTRRGPIGWLARRWMLNHPLQLTIQIYKPEWGEWREVVGQVRVV